jgi:hypothetical protein
MRRLMLSFSTILRVGKVVTLRRWMTHARATGIEALQRFVRKLQQDQRAVEGAVRERWSNGPVEGTLIASKCCGVRCTAAPASSSSAPGSYR